MQRYQDVLKVTYLILMVPYAYSIECKDINPYCSYWAIHGECLHNPKYVVSNCPVECSMASTCGNTTDIADGCWNNASNGECETSMNFRERLCNTTCSIRANVTCKPPLSHPLTTNTEKSTYRFLDRVKYKCIDGYHDSGGRLGQRVCTQDGTWLVRYLKQGKLPNCKPISCKGPPELNNTEIEYNGTLYTDRVIYRCALGFSRTSGDVERFCQANKSWNGTNLGCQAITCGDPPILNNTDSEYNGTLYTDRVFYQCSSGFFSTSGDVERFCQANTSWNGTDLVCQAILSTTVIDSTSNTVTDDPGWTISPSAVFRSTESAELFSSETSYSLHSSFSELVRKTSHEQIQEDSSSFVSQEDSWFDSSYSSDSKIFSANTDRKMSVENLESRLNEASNSMIQIQVSENYYISSAGPTAAGTIESDTLSTKGFVAQRTYISSITDLVQISTKLIVQSTVNAGVQMTTEFVHQLSTEPTVQPTVEISQSTTEPNVQWTTQLVQSETTVVRPSAKKCSCKCTKPGQMNSVAFSSMSFEAIMNLTPSVKKFSPEPVEAEGAKYVGASAIVILGCTFGLIILMDMVSISRHINLLRYNFNFTDVNPLDSDVKKT